MDNRRLPFDDRQNHFDEHFYEKPCYGDEHHCHHHHHRPPPQFPNPPQYSNEKWQQPDYIVPWDLPRPIRWDNGNKPHCEPGYYHDDYMHNYRYNDQHDGYEHHDKYRYHDYHECHQQPEFIKPWSPYDLDDFRNGQIPAKHGQPIRVESHETQRSTEIRDSIGNLKFIVSMASYVPGENTAFEIKYKDKNYLLDVISYCGPEPLNIFHTEYYEIDKASECYDKLVEQYEMIAKVETQHFQDIGVFADKINYRCVDECCATCKWAKKLGMEDDIFGPHPIDGRYERENRYFQHNLSNHDRNQCNEKFVCMNRKLFVSSEIHGDLDKHAGFSIEPEVDANCICDSYERKSKELPPTIPQSLCIDDDRKEQSYHQNGRIL